MSVITNNLMPKEEILIHALITIDAFKYRALIVVVFLGLCYISQTAFFTIFSVLAAIPCMILIAVWYFDYAGEELVLTNQRVIAKHGFFSHRVDSMIWEKVESVSIYQGVLGRKFNYGVINIFGVGGESVGAGCVANPSEFRKKAIKRIGPE